MRLHPLSATLTSALLAAACSSSPPADRAPPVADAQAAGPASADMVLRGGRIFTAAPGGFASAVAIDDGVIAYVGDDAGAAAYVGAGTRVVDLGGRVVLPGLHDVHQHPLEAHLNVVDCAMSPDAIDAEDHAADLALCAPSAVTGWVLGSGHAVEVLADARRAPKAIIDAVFPDTPVAILERSSHSTWVNSAALARLGIDDATPDPRGGIIVRDARGAATGILVDAAGELPWDRALRSSPALDALNRQAVRAGQALNSRHGITSAVDARTYVGRGHLDAWRAAARDDELTVRMVLSLWASPAADDDAQLAELAPLYADDGGLLRVTQGFTP